jgi:hypothetical protein
MTDARPVHGYVSLIGGHDERGPVTCQELVRRGVVTSSRPHVPAGWGAAREEVGLGQNLFVDVGRQLMAYCFAFRAPVSDYTCQFFGCGTGESPAQVTDVALESAAEFSPSIITKLVDGADFPDPFVARVQLTIAQSECNGLLLTEFGLFSGNGTMFARYVDVGISKTSDTSLTFAWRLRF